MASLIVKTGARRMFPAPLLLLAALYSFVNLWNTAHAQFPVHFSCPQLPPLTKPAQNVYELRPQDIKVVMAMGDSITAGEGAASTSTPARYSYCDCVPHLMLGPFHVKVI